MCIITGLLAPLTFLIKVGKVNLLESNLGQRIVSYLLSYKSKKSQVLVKKRNGQNQDFL